MPFLPGGTAFLFAQTHTMRILEKQVGMGLCGKIKPFFELLLEHPSTSYLCLCKVISSLVPLSLPITPLCELGLGQAEHEN